MKIYGVVFGLILLQLGYHNVVFAGTKSFAYRVEVPDSSGGCESQVQKVARALSSISGVQVTSQTCKSGNEIADQGQKYKRNVITVNYSADAEALPSVARFSGRETEGIPTADSGLFLKYSECLEASKAEEKTFEVETQSKVAASYCLSSFTTFSPGYSLIIEGFGKAVRKLYSFSTDEFGTIHYSVPKSYVNSVQSDIVADGGHIVRVDSDHIFYYSEQPVVISMFNFGSFPESSSCEAQNSEAKNIYSSQKLKNVVSVCAGNNELLVMGSGSTQVREDYSSQSPRYSSFSDCRDDRDRMVQNALSNSLKVIGGICKPSFIYRGEYALTLYFSL